MRYLLTLALALLSIVASAAIEDPTIRLRQIDATAAAEAEAYVTGWLVRCNLAPLEIPITTDTGEAAAKHLHHIKQVNARLALARRIVEAIGTPLYGYDAHAVRQLMDVESIGMLMESQGQRIPPVPQITLAPIGR